LTATTPAKRKPRAALNPTQESIQRWAEAVIDAGADRKWDRKTVAKFLGISPTYLNLLATGGSPTQETISRPVITRSAELLNLPVIAALLLAGGIHYEDFYDTHVDATASIARGWRLAKKEVRLLPYLPTEAEWQRLSPRTQFNQLCLFEEITHRDYTAKLASICLTPQ
jgi:hypothetical protein